MTLYVDVTLHRQLGQALEFLHADVKMLHRNVCPESVIINKAGAWKLAGFEFCQANKAPADQSVRGCRGRWWDGDGTEIGNARWCR